MADDLLWMFLIAVAVAVIALILFKPEPGPEKCPVGMTILRKTDDSVYCAPREKKLPSLEQMGPRGSESI